MLRERGDNAGDCPSRARLIAFPDRMFGESQKKNAALTFPRLLATQQIDGQNRKCCTALIAARFGGPDE